MRSAGIRAIAQAVIQQPPDADPDTRQQMHLLLVREAHGAMVLAHCTRLGTSQCMDLCQHAARHGAEAAVVDLMISTNPAFARRYRAQRDLVAALCTRWVIAPPDHVQRRLLHSIETKR